MATIKLATLAIRTIAKPISTRLKQEARQHPFFRSICVELAQKMYRYEAKLGTVVLGQPPRTIKPLSETRAIDNGANFIAESFLFLVAASLILAETWRSSNKETKRREGVSDQLEELANDVRRLSEDLSRVSGTFEVRWNEERTRTDELARVLQTIVDIGLRGGWVEFQDTPLKVPKIQLTPEGQPSTPQPHDHPPEASPESKDKSQDIL